MLDIQEVTYTAVLLNGSIADKNTRTLVQLSPGEKNITV